MKNQFVPYEFAVKLKELRFDEKTMGWWVGNGPKEGWYVHPANEHLMSIGSEVVRIKAPLWQQAFDWFREKYDLLNFVSSHLNDWGEDNSLIECYGYKIMYNKDCWKCKVWDKLSDFETYEEARLALLDKLIEIVEEL